MPIKKEICYPVFLECCHYTQDIFWEKIFEDLAYGQPPYGTYINKDFLCCSYKKKEFTYKIERKDPKILYEEIYDLLINKLGLLSQREKLKKRLAFQNIEENMKDSRKEWGNIRKKNIKNLLIEQFVIRMREKHNITLKQAKYLLSIIFLASVFRVITSKDIEYKNGQIQSIKGIDFIKNQFVFTKGLYDIEVSFSPQIVMDKKMMIDNWEKYLKDIRKLI